MHTCIVQKDATRKLIFNAREFTTACTINHFDSKIMVCIYVVITVISIKSFNLKTISGQNDVVAQYVLHVL